MCIIPYSSPNRRNKWVTFSNHTLKLQLPNRKTGSKTYAKLKAFTVSKSNSKVDKSCFKRGILWSIWYHRLKWQKMRVILDYRKGYLGPMMLDWGKKHIESNRLIGSMCRLDQLQTALKAQDFLHLEHSVIKTTTIKSIPRLNTHLPTKLLTKTPIRTLTIWTFKISS